MCYPLPIRGESDWQPTSDPDRWQTKVELVDLQPGELLLPSVALQTRDHYAVRCTLKTPEASWPLVPINTDPSAAGQSVFPDSDATPKNAGGEQNSDPTAAVSTHLDVFAVHRTVPAATLTVELRSRQSPEDYLLVVSRRQQTQELAPGEVRPASQRPELQVPNLSQMVQPSSQNTRTCSPTALSMLMSYYGAPYHPAFVDRCKEPSSGLYGVWPLNIMQASRRGFVAAAELVSSWEELADTSAPFIASVRFEAEQLTGAPLVKTPGHLVLVRGTSDTHVFCNDPAAASASSVARSYSLEEFSNAWLGHRGATYIVVPAEAPACAAESAPAAAQLR